MDLTTITMRMSLRVKITIAIILAGLAIYLVVVFSSDGKVDSAKYRQEFNRNIRQSKVFRDVQLDSARVYAAVAVQLAEKVENDLWINQSTLNLAEIEFLRIGASDELYVNVEQCESWFREQKRFKEAFRANLLRLEIKSFLKGFYSVAEDISGLIGTAELSESDESMGKAYYFKMEHRDMMGTWEDDVHILDSARMFSARAKDSVSLAKIRITSVLPINGKAASFDSTFISLKEALKWNSSELLCTSYVTLGMQYGPIRKVDSALYFLKKNIKLTNQWGSNTFKMNAYQRMVRTHLYALDYDAMISDGEKALSLARSAQNKELERIILKEMGYAWSKKGQFYKGVDYATQAVKVARQLGNEDGIFSSQYALVDFLLKSERFEEADTIVSDMLSWTRTTEKNYVNNGRNSRVFLLKGRLQEANGNLDSALYSFRQAGTLLKKHSGRNRLVVDLKILSNLLKSDKLEEAKVQYEFMHTFYANYESKKYFRDFYFLEGKLMNLLGDDFQTIEALNLFLELTNVGNSENCYDAHLLLSKAYSNTGKFKNALEHSQRAIDIKEEINETNDALKLEKIQSKNDLSDKEIEIGQLKIDRLEQENKLQTRRLYIIFLSVFLILLVVIVLFIYNRAKQARVREGLKRVALEKERYIEQMKAEESERTVDLKNQLFANISHEFRTPLTMIQAPVEELMENLKDENQNSLQIVKRNADHLLVMVDEILELAKLDSGNATLSLKEINLKSFIQKIRMNFEPLFRQKEIRFEKDLPSDEFTMIADEYRLKMVLNNILKNAFHHTSESGEIRISASTDEDKGLFEVSVFNSGDWIDPDFLPIIFERFSRSKEKEYSGYGIGLSFCKQIVSLHMGTIEVQNVEGGVLVSFSIPSAIGDTELDEIIQVENVSEETSAHSIQGSDRKLLIVEDNLEMQNLLNDLLIKEYELIFAHNGEDGIDKAEQHQPDLIISDIMMPKLFGTELARTLKENFSTSHIPIILLTAKSGGHDRIAGLETGADDYLTKPFSPKELRVRVKNLIQQRDKLKRRFSKNVFLAPEDITSNSLDQEFLSRATEIVESNLDNSEFSVTQFCRKLAMNRNSVHQKLKSLTGTSASQFIKSVKLKKAATLLADERISIVEVSELSGFNNRQVFNKAFKAQFEMTPSDYRKECLKKNE